MADNTKQQLFGEFPAVSTEQWESFITADLKGDDYERKLVWRTDEGFHVRPYYRAENLEGIKFLGTASGQFPYVRGVCKNNKWRIHQTVGVKCLA
ncbi:MAG: methylmalonyl-CoA mutase small subunit, partial [Rikenellaceae bacterium]|nr:methylmalonyl-CoA mutase small subunit [Rikenellaceae bacterium]